VLLTSIVVKLQYLKFVILFTITDMCYQRVEPLGTEISFASRSAPFFVHRIGRIPFTLGRTIHKHCSSHRLLKSLEDLGSEYIALLFNTEVLWNSCGRVI